MKTNSKKAKAVIAIVCILAFSVGAVFAFRYINRAEKPVSKTTAPETSAVTQTSSQAITEAKITTEKDTERPSGTDNEETAANKTILNYPQNERFYTPTGFEAKLFNAINEKRKENGISPLNWNDCLHIFTKTRADEAAALFSHTRPDGKKPSSVLTDENISFTLFGECLLKGTKENDEGVSLLIEGLMKEKEQSDMILNGDYKYAATAISVDESGNVTAAVLFCNP